MICCSVVSSGGGGGGGGSTKLIPALPSIFSQASLESGVNFSVRVNNSVVFDLNNDVNLYFSEVNESYLVLKINNFSGQKISVGERVNLSVGEIVYLIYQNYSFGRANIFAQMIVPVEEKGEDVEFSGPYSPFSERIYTFFSDNILLAVVLFLVVLLMLIPRKTKGNK